MSETPSRSALGDAFALLARRDLSEGELRDRLVRRGHPDEEIGTAIDGLRERRLVDDDALARAVARRLSAERLYGPARVRARLVERRFGDEVADAAVRGAFPEGAEERGAARALARLRVRQDRTPGPRRPPDEGGDGVGSRGPGEEAAGRERARAEAAALVRRLMRRGYSPDAARAAVFDRPEAGDPAFGEMEPRTP